MKHKPTINENIVLDGITSFSREYKNYRPNYFHVKDITYLYVNGYVDTENDDGYILAKMLEEKFEWKIFTERVLELDQVHFYIRKAYYDYLKKWIEDNNIKSKFKKGDIIILNNKWWKVIGYDEIIPFSYKLHLIKSTVIDESLYVTMWCDYVDENAYLAS